MRIHFQRVALFLMFIIIGLLFQPVNHAKGQSSTPVYWRYDAPGRLNEVVITDINNDGVDEFIVISDDVNIVLVGPDGVALWDNPYQVTETLHALTAISFAGQPQNRDQIVIGTGQQLILVNSDGEELWRRQLENSPTVLKRYKPNNSESERLMVALADGALHQYGGQGELIWRHSFTDPPAENAFPKLLTADLNRDGSSEIIYSYLSQAGFSKIVVLNTEGQPLWERSNSGQITAMSIIEFDEDSPLEIAVATTLNRVYLYSDDGSRRWPYRSVNVPITTLTMAQLDQGPALVVGTAAGTVIAYDQQGRRYWDGSYSDTTGQPIIAVTAPPHSTRVPQPAALAVLIGRDSGNSEPVDVILLDSAGQRLDPAYPGADAAGLSHLVDINRDGKSELLLAGFATLELLDPGIGARQFFESWDYRLGAEPTSALLEDIDLDGNPELLVGTSDGKLHALRTDGSIFWVADLGGIVSDLAFARTGADSLPVIVAVFNEIIVGEAGLESSSGSIVVLRPDGRQVWKTSLNSTISTIITANINRSGPPELLVGTADGQIIAFSLTGDEYWRSPLNASINNLDLLSSSRVNEIIFTTGANSVGRINIKGSRSSQIAEYLEDISTMDLIALDELENTILVGLEDGTLRGLSTRGNQEWMSVLGGTPNITLFVGDSLIVGTDEQELNRIDMDGNILWSVPDIGHSTSLYWGDLDGDVRPDLAAGDRDGHLRLVTEDGQNIWQSIDLVSEVFFVTAVKRSTDLQVELVAVTENGVVQLYKPQANRPPLLINPKTEVGQGEYTILVTVVDVENDPVVVALEILDPKTGLWEKVGEKTASNGDDTLFWSLTPPDDATEVQYRFLYNDGTHSGLLAPPEGPPPIISKSLLPNILIGLFAVAIIAGGTGFYVIRSRSPATRIRRFYQRIKQQPATTLDQLEVEYNRAGGSPDFLLNLANKARQEHNETLARLVDGLFLLSTGPDSALPLINSTLEEAESQEPPWKNLGKWQDTYRTGEALLSAPTLTELALLRSQLEQVIRTREEAGYPSESLDGLLPILNSMRDSQRVDLAEDRLVYLTEALGLLRQLQYQDRYWPIQSENKLVDGIVDRWYGLVTAEIEELHGQAQIEIRLLTEHIIPGDQTVVALEVKNVGRAAAEQVAVEMKDDPTYEVQTPTHMIPYLSPGRERQLHFNIVPHVSDNFRALFTIYYDDRSGSGKRFAFADMVHLLSKEREFSPIMNRYSPGMPLRSKSTVFFGRDDLFEFIQNNAARPSQRNVLILIGQRRTGKTSALLQLDQHLPGHLIPVFVDCQALGVTPGMPALLRDLAWIISDTLASRGYDLPVPDLPKWQADATGLFQRDFLTKLRNMLPVKSTVLLIFDEFEAIEDLVRDQMLPATIFTYLRHLMQHGQGLSFIFAGTHRLEEIGSDYWSVLFNSALYRHVGFLSDEAARRLIRDPVSPNLIYDDLALDKILRVTAGHPYFLQLVCYTLVNQANNARQGYVTISDVNAALEEMLRLGEVHFAYLWQRSSYTEKALLAAASRLMDYETPFRPEDLVLYLAEYRFYLDPGEVTASLNRLVEREIMRELAGEAVSLYELRIGLVGLWVSQNKSLSRLYEKSREQ